MALAWVIVANRSQARLFKANRAAGKLHELESMIHPESRMNGRDLVSDAPGRAFDSAGRGRHAMGNLSELHHLNGQKFAREIAHRLERGRNEGLYKKLYIVAEPQMIGSLRDMLKPPTRATIAGIAGKNLINFRPEEIRAQLPRWL